MRVPEFLVRQFYVPGSLRNEADGFRLQATNPIADGTLVGIGRISVDGLVVDPAAVSATLGGDGTRAGDVGRARDETRHRAADVTRRTPVAFRRGDVVTFHVAGPPLDPGPHAFEVEVFELDMGRLTLALTDTIGTDQAADPDRAAGPDQAPGD
ncbi:hypothetical protein BH23CHL8_BH23CHL8_26090 [soil metagenome]